MVVFISGVYKYASYSENIPYRIFNGFLFSENMIRGYIYDVSNIDLAKKRKMKCFKQKNMFIIVSVFRLKNDSCF